MKLLQRTKGYETARFSSSFSDFSQTKNRMLATTRNSFGSSFGSRAEGRLPQLNRSYSFSGSKSAKQKLGDMEERLEELSKNLNELKLQTRDSRRFTNFLKQDLAQKLLNEHKHKILQKIGTLDRQSKLTRQSNEQKTDLLKKDCQRLHDSSILINKLLMRVSEQLDNLQNTMGVYSGKEKHIV